MRSHATNLRGTCAPLLRLAQRSEAVHSALKRVVSARMTLTELVCTLVSFSELKELRTEMLAARRALVQTFNRSSVLPAVVDFEKLKLVSPYAIGVLRAQAAQSCKYEVVLAAHAAEGGSEAATYVVAPMGSGALTIARAYGAALAASADGTTAAAKEAATAAAVAASATSIAELRAAAASGAAGSGGAAGGGAAAGDGLEGLHAAVDAGLAADDPAAFRLVSLLRCSCQFPWHSG